MKKSSVFSIKREQKKSFLLQEISALVRRLTADEPRISSLFVTRIEMSRDSGVCYVYFSTYTNKEAFDEGLGILKLYKPSMRKSLAEAMHSRYVPNLIFRYDLSKEKERKMTTLLDKLEHERDDKED